MNEHLPYEDEIIKRLDDLPLPNEDVAWEDMKHRLEKDDKDRPIIPPLLKGCGGYVLLSLVLMLAFLFIVDPAKWFHDKTKSGGTKTDSIENKKREIKIKIDSNKTIHANGADKKIELNDNTASTQKEIGRSTLANDTLIEKKEDLKNRSSYRRTNKVEKKYAIVKKQNIHSFRQANKNISSRNNHRHKPVTKKINGRIKSIVSGNAETDTLTDVSQIVNKNEEQQQDNFKKAIDSIVPNAKPGSDSLKRKLTVPYPDNKKDNNDSRKQNRIYFSAGLGVHQLLPVAGQKSNPYNSLGRKSSLSDYIPSVYLRMYKDKKWFIQSEFRYGVPQYTKEILFNQKIIFDSSSSSRTSTNSRLKKTFYHQLPVSFNHFVLPGFSIGAGVTFNKFSSALVQQDVHKTNVITQTDSLVSTELVKQKKADSNFVTSYMQALIEAQYKWRRLSGGIRYSFGLQPYLKFKLPGGEERKERNNSLQIFIRYELWRSGNRNKN